MLISLCLPCKINVLEDNGIKIIGMNPKIMRRFFSEVSEDDAKEIYNELKEMIDSSK